MRKLFFIVSLILSFSFTLQNHSSNADYKKKVKKVLNKIWLTGKIETKAVEFPDTIAQPDFSVNSIFHNNEFAGFYCIKEANGCHLGGCDKSDPDVFVSEYEKFVYMIVFEPDLTIKKVEVIDYKSNYGFQVTSKKWLKQFIGISSGEMFGYGQNIDAISGATTSGKSLVDNTNEICNVMLELRNKKLI